MALHLLDRNRDGAVQLAQVLEEAVRRVRHCELCRMLTEEPICSVCRSDRRDGSQLCVLETPADLLAIENSGAFGGRYFVLMGHLSPLDGIGPQELGLELLERRLQSGEVREVVLATSVTVEGDATAHLIATLAQRHGVLASRIAHGVPTGGELEFVDAGTLSRALTGRRAMEHSAEGVEP